LQSAQAPEEVDRGDLRRVFAALQRALKSTEAARAPGLRPGIPGADGARAALENRHLAEIYGGESRIE
jgi:hypothetical protein